ncbi:DUF397 domain-containing protein [Streptomyces sp. NPDC058701]|uniref:DUF397 domain-containing protein n=1 Tax=Streptomyces sp. NPDC058701 TaxID=3346608 RepID=UPI003654E35B
MAERLNWRTSSYTKSDSCVEVADNDPAKVVVRDTKWRDRAIVGVDPAAWAVFVSFVRLPG